MFLISFILQTQKAVHEERLFGIFELIVVQLYLLSILFLFMLKELQP